MLFCSKLKPREELDGSPIMLLMSPSCDGSVPENRFERRMMPFW
jgi:hypothetical protein